VSKHGGSHLYINYDTAYTTGLKGPAGFALQGYGIEVASGDTITSRLTNKFTSPADHCDLTVSGASFLLVYDMAGHRVDT